MAALMRAPSPACGVRNSVPIPMRSSTCRAASPAAFGRNCGLLASPRNSPQVVTATPLGGHLQSSSLCRQSSVTNLMPPQPRSFETPQQAFVSGGAPCRSAPPPAGPLRATPANMPHSIGNLRPTPQSSFVPPSSAPPPRVMPRTSLGSEARPRRSIGSEHRPSRQVSMPSSCGGRSPRHPGPPMRQMSVAFAESETKTVLPAPEHHPTQMFLEAVSAWTAAPVRTPPWEGKKMPMRLPSNAGFATASDEASMEQPEATGSANTTQYASETKRVFAADITDHIINRSPSQLTTDKLSDGTQKSQVFEDFDKNFGKSDAELAMFIKNLSCNKPPKPSLQPHEGFKKVFEERGNNESMMLLQNLGCGKPPKASLAHAHEEFKVFEDLAKASLAHAHEDFKVFEDSAPLAVARSVEKQDVAAPTSDARPTSNSVTEVLEGEAEDTANFSFHASKGFDVQRVGTTEAIEAVCEVVVDARDASVADETLVKDPLPKGPQVPPPRGRGKPPGKAPGPPPPGKRPSPGTSSNLTDIQLRLKQSYSKQQHETVFDGRSSSCAIDVQRLTSLAQSRMKERRASATGLVSQTRDEVATAVLAHTRALPIEIALKRFPMSTSQLADVLKGMDFQPDGLGAEDLERLFAKMPTAAESEKLLAQAKSGLALTPLEESLEPLCKVPDVERRLRMVHCAMSHASQHATLLAQFSSIQAAASEAVKCTKLHEVALATLEIANAINHGQAEGAHTFPLSSFSAFASFKIGESSVLHYLCYILCTEEFVQHMAANLTNVAAATSSCTRNLQESMRAFKDNLEVVKAHIDGETRVDARLRCGTLLGGLEAEYLSLQEAEKNAMAAAKGAQQYFGERSQMQFEEFCRHIMGIVQSLQKAGAEVHGHVDFWEQHIASPTREEIVAPVSPVKETSLTSVTQHVQDIAAMLRVEETNMATSTQRRGPGNMDRRELAAPARVSEVNAAGATRHMIEQAEGERAMEQAAPEQRARRMTLQDAGSAEQAEQAEQRVRRRSLQEADQRARRLSLQDGATTRVSWLASGTSVRNAVDNYNEFA